MTIDPTFTSRCQELRKVDTKNWIDTSLTTPAPKKGWKGWRIAKMIFVQPFYKLIGKDAFANIRADSVARKVMKDYNVEMAKDNADYKKITGKVENLIGKLFSTSKNKKRGAIVAIEHITLWTIQNVLNRGAEECQDSNLLYPSPLLDKLTKIDLKNKNLCITTNLQTKPKPGKFLRALKQIFVQPFYKLVGKDAFRATRVDNVARSLMAKYNTSMRIDQNRVELTTQSIAILEKLHDTSKNAKRKAVVAEQIANLKTIQRLLKAPPTEPQIEEEKTHTGSQLNLPCVLDQLEFTNSDNDHPLFNNTPNIEDPASSPAGAAKPKKAGNPFADGWNETEEVRPIATTA